MELKAVFVRPYPRNVAQSSTQLTPSTVRAIKVQPGRHPSLEIHVDEGNNCAVCILLTVQLDSVDPVILHAALYPLAG